MKIRDRIKLLLETNPQGLTSEQIAKLVKAPAPSVRRCLGEIGAAKKGGTKKGELAIHIFEDGRPWSDSTPTLEDAARGRPDEEEPPLPAAPVNISLPVYDSILPITSGQAYVFTVRAPRPEEIGEDGRILPPKKTPVEKRHLTVEEIDRAEVTLNGRQVLSLVGDSIDSN